MSQKSLRILFTGGGTGGHIYPIVAVAEELKRITKEKGIEADLRFFGAPGQYFNLLELSGIRVVKIASSKLRRYFDIRNFFDFFKFIFSLFQCLWKILWFMPDVVFSKGGPGALAVLLVCRFYRIPIFIHESDSIPGLTNLVSAKWARRIGLSFNSAINYFRKNKNFDENEFALVGHPARKIFFEPGDDTELAKKVLGFNPGLPLILFVGGSQGATAINDFVLDSIGELLKDYQVLHQTGIKNFEQVKKEWQFLSRDFFDEEKLRYKVVPYLEDKDLKEAILAADLVVSRAGAGSIFELAAMGEPSILVPLPDAASGHQIRNAYEYSQTGAAVVIEQSNLRTHLFMVQAQKFFGNPELLKQMSEAAKNFSKPDAAKLLAEEILRLARA
ncbi:MAG: UDP-N-acetylglucosamine--N-acetylmuramyl-(pentapeptide) pyrophosphoryl-undecaprenol N-acetylglucosamine transferase [Candidatus Paceibacterota bacterium]|jgi:UDP-N-acetylglucosamine--N-acetylmuramyl-(pentapeptide) pyrophosphoryl-undecaprenol N-acetylglucosamine transferase